MDVNLKPKAPYIMVIAAAFLLYQLYILQNSFQADYQIYQSVSATVAQNGFLFRPVFWLFSELTVEVGLFVCVAGAFFFLAFALVLLTKGQLMFGYLRRAVLLQGIQYLFVIPFIVLLFMGTGVSSHQAAVSYVLQIILVTPSFLILYFLLRQPSVNQAKILRWTAIALTGFVFSLWIKHFIFNIYALPIDFQNPVLTVGFLNSALTMLASSMLTLIAFLPVIRGKTLQMNSRLFGFALVLVGVYFVVYCCVCLFDAQYLSFLKLTELWAVSLPILGYAFIAKHLK